MYFYIFFKKKKQTTLISPENCYRVGVLQHVNKYLHAKIKKL